MPVPELKPYRPFWLAPAHVLRAGHLPHLAHVVLTLLGLGLIGHEYVSGIRVHLPPFHIDKHHWELWLGALVLLFAAVNSGLLGRAVRWRHQSVKIPRWQDDELPAADDIVLEYAGGRADIKVLLRFLAVAFPPRWFLPRSLDDRQALLEKLHRACPRSIVLILQRGPKGQRLIGCSLVAPLIAEAFWEYRNGEADNWRFEGKDFVDRSPLLLSNYLFCYGRKYRRLLRDLFLAHAAALCPTGDPLVTVIAPRMTSAGKVNMQRLGAHRVGQSIHHFPLYELDLRREAELGANARATLAALRAVVAAPTLTIGSARLPTPAPVAPAQPHLDPEVSLRQDEGSPV